MFRCLDDFFKCWQEESKVTLRLLEAIPDSAMHKHVAEGHRDLRRMAWHLVESLLEMPDRMGLELEGRHYIQGGFIQDPPATMAAIHNAYAKASGSLMRVLESWKDEDLLIQDEMYGELWARGRTLTVLLLHQAHHRGQMTVLMRQAGLKVPEVYGPTQEGWANYGLEAPKV